VFLPEVVNMATGYTLGLFANMYPAYDGDYKGIFIQQMVRDLEACGVIVKKAVKTSASVTGYVPFYYRSLLLARDNELDVMQAEYIPHSSIIPVLFRRKICPLVLKFHGDDARIFPFKNPFFKALTSMMIRHSDYVITSSEEIRVLLISIGAQPDKISSVHSGVDTEFFHPVPKEVLRNDLALPDDLITFVFIGRLHPWKGLNEIISVAGICPEFRFIFLGPGTVPAHPENCVFLGPKTPEDVRNWICASDCLLLPSYSEGFPTVIMEAFACGIPVITTNVGGCPELVEPEKTGFLIPVRDIKALADAVNWMGTHSAERVKMGKHARSIAVERFDHKKMVKKLMDIHLHLINQQ